MANNNYGDVAKLSRDLERMDGQSLFILLGAITEESFSSRPQDPKHTIVSEIIQKLYEYPHCDVMKVHKNYVDAANLSRDLENMDVQSMFILLGAITQENYSSRPHDPKRLVAAETIQKLYEYTPWDVMKVYPVEGPWICGRLFPDPGGWFEAAAMGMSRADIIGMSRPDITTS